MRPADLERALREQNVAGRVESFDRLAVLVPEEGGEPLDFTTLPARARVLELAREMGFSHLALEIPEPASRAALRRG